MIKNRLESQLRYTRKQLRISHAISMQHNRLRASKNCVPVLKMRLIAPTVFTCVFLHTHNTKRAEILHA